MNMYLLEDSAEVEIAFKQLREVIGKGSKRISCNVGWPSGNGDFRLYWRPQEKFWSLLEKAETKFWCGFGTKDPTLGQSVNFTVQINPSFDPNSRKTEGLFLRDEKGQYHLGRGGELTRGHSSMGASAFFEMYQGDRLRVEWPDTKEKYVAVIGRINSPSFVEKLRNFILAVEEFKALPGGQRTGKDSPLETPEFFGKRKPYQPPRSVHSENTHGLVVNELHRILSVSQLVKRTLMIDLFVSSDSSMTHLFEIKTTPNRSDIYQAIGQLMIHGACQGKSPRRILVIPGCPSADTLAKIHEIGIEVLEYRWAGKKPVFVDLSKIFQT